MGKMLLNGIEYVGGRNTGGASALEDLTDVNVSSITDGQILKYDSTTSKWVNDDESGGTVTDVQVNGTTVVDSNKVAQITSYKELTRAEYDLLPDTKYSDGIMYCITDGFSNVNGFPPLIYSTEEREVGVWIDGKPVYQKTVSFAPSGSANTLNIAHNISNIERVIKYEGSLRYSSGSSNDNRFLPQLYKDNVDYYSASVYSVNNTNINLVYGNWLKEQASIFTVCVTLYYTKTTDTAGSGKWATDGGLAKHYSTSEQIIGTWIDGKPLYQKTFFYPGPYSGNANHELPLLSGIEFVSFSMLVGKNQDGLGLVIPYVNAATQYSIAVWILSDSSKMNLATYGGNTITNLVAVVNYTKTTD